MNDSMTDLLYLTISNIEFKFYDKKYMIKSILNIVIIYID